jgi:ABC-type phosphate/phosphonate transport system substrate-binding protein
MKKLYKLFGIIAIVALIGFALAGCDNGNTDDESTKPGELSADASYDEAVAKLDEIIRYCSEELAVQKSAASTYKTTIEAMGSDNWADQKATYISGINNMIASLP